MHFSVAVITEGKPDIYKLDNMLAPFQENNMGDCPQEYLEFCEEDTEQYKEDYETEVLTKYKLRDGSYVDFLNERNDAHRGAVKTDILAKELYPNFNDYLIEEIRLTYDEQKGKFGYWSNPDAEWDWYSFGGRWAGYLKFNKDDKNCITFCKGTTNVFGDNMDDRYKCEKYQLADCGRIKDLIIEPDAEEKRVSSLEWELKVEGRAPKNKFEEAILKNLEFDSPEWLKNVYKDKQTYVKESRHISTHAVLTKEGMWYTIEGNVEEFKKYVIDEADDNDYISIVDCHI